MGSASNVGPAPLLKDEIRGSCSVWSLEPNVDPSALRFMPPPLIPLGNSLAHPKIVFQKLIFNLIFKTSRGGAPHPPGPPLD